MTPIPTHPWSPWLGTLRAGRSVGTAAIGIALWVNSGASGAAFAQRTEAVAPVSSAAASGPAAPSGPAEPLLDGLRQRFRDPSWFAAAPSNLRFRADGGALAFARPLPDQAGPEQRVLVLEDGLERPLASGEAIDFQAPAGPLVRDADQELLGLDGDLFLRSGGALIGGGAGLVQLSRTTRSERPLALLDGGSRVAFEADGRVYAQQLQGGLITELFDVRFQKDPEAEEEPKQEDELQSSQARLIQTLEQRRARREAAEEREKERRKADPTRPPLPFYLEDKLFATERKLSASGRYLAVSAARSESGDEQDQMPDYVTESGYVATRRVRPLVGVPKRSGERLFLLDREQHTVLELDLSALPGLDQDPLAERVRAREARQKQAAKPEVGAAEGLDSDRAVLDAEPEQEPLEQGALSDSGSQETGDARSDSEPSKPALEGTEPVEAAPTPAPVKRAVSVTELQWSPAGDRLLASVRSQDNKDRWLVLFTPGDATPRVLERLNDPAWIGWDFNAFGWLPAGEGLWWLSESDGYARLYTQWLNAGQARPLSPAGSEVSQPQLSPDGRWLYLLSNATEPGIHQLARVGLPAGPFELLSPALGRVEEYTLAPDGNRIAYLCSLATQPPEVYLMEARPGAEPRALTHSTTGEFDGVRWIEPRFVEVAGPAGPIRGRLYSPPEGAPPAFPEGRAAVLFVHGAGYLQNAHQGWSDYFHEFFFHDLLARQGLVVLDLDYRASAGYGRDWRTAIHLCMGIPELEDLAAGVDYLVETQGVARQRIGVYGGSYGGFLTLMALFTRPELFAAGAALRPVTDWRHYNDGYTRNILETPELAPEVFAACSPIDHAEGLEKPLLICHGLVDDNVLTKDSIRLAQRLIELQKTDWELALYPVEAHGFKEPSSWIDEYTRIWKLFERTLL